MLIGETNVNHEQIQAAVGGDYDLLSETTDEHGREVVCVEVTGAHRRWLREEVDGTVCGPLTEGAWVNMLAAETDLGHRSR